MKLRLRISHPSAWLGMLFLLALGCISAAPAAEIQPAFKVTGSMGTARYFHTATLLTNGQVLTVGGYNFYSPGYYLSSAELYDPVTGVYIVTGDLGAARYAHTATLLADGRVLIAGGYNKSGYLASAELYDPAAGTFTTTGPMIKSRYLHAATLLVDGRVLITGGYSASSGYLASAELFDPSTGTFMPAASMINARQKHTATALSDGRVLITGGSVGTTFISPSEIYDPVTTAFSPAGMLVTARAQHTATLLTNGKVLIAGGTCSTTCLAAGVTGELYDPAAGIFTATGPLVAMRYVHTATLLPDGQVVLSGGKSPQTMNYLSSVEVFDPAMGIFSSAGAMAVARSNHTSTLLQDGKVLIAGGSDSSSNYLSSSELFGTFGPDLTISGLTIAPLVPVAGQPVTVTATVSNNGDLAAGAFQVALYQNLGVAPAVTQLGDLQCSFASLAAGGSATCTGTMTYSVAGNDSLWAQVDVGDAVNEVSETNNVAGPVAVSVILPPDLSISALTIAPLVPVAGQPVTVTATVSNNGDLAAGAFQVALYQNLGVAPAVTQLGDLQCSFASLAAGGSATCTGTMTYSVAGNGSLWAQVDVGDAVNEVSETNNVAGPVAVSVILPASNDAGELDDDRHQSHHHKGHHTKKDREPGKGYDKSHEHGNRKLTLSSVIK